MWRVLFKPLMRPFGYRLIRTIDFDGVNRVRFAKYLEHGMLVKGIASYFMLRHDGQGSSYIRRWYEL